MITDADAIAGEVVINISETEFTGTLPGSPTSWYSEGATVSLSARITDLAGNSTEGSASATNIVIDETLPTIANYVISSALSLIHI